MSGWISAELPVDEYKDEMKTEARATVCAGIV